MSKTLEEMEELNRQAEAKVTRLTNALRQTVAQRDELLSEVVDLENTERDRVLAACEAVLTNETRPYWAEQLVTNRKAATEALMSMAKLGEKPAAEGETRKPLHNRGTARPVVPTVDAVTVRTAAEEARSVKLRNRAQEISAGEGIPFQTAFLRAEREVAE